MRHLSHCDTVLLRDDRLQPFAGLHAGAVVRLREIQWLTLAPGRTVQVSLALNAGASERTGR